MPDILRLNVEENIHALYVDVSSLQNMDFPKELLASKTFLKWPKVNLIQFMFQLDFFRLTQARDFLNVSERKERLESQMATRFQKSPHSYDQISNEKTVKSLVSGPVKLNLFP